MRKIRKKFKRPKVSWDSDSIKENKKLSLEYGLRRRKELLISHEILRGFRQRTRQLIAERDEEKENTLTEKLARLGLLTSEKKDLDDVLALTIRNLLDRRLQTIVFRSGLATGPLHARQLITHGHIRIRGRKVKFPSYLVQVAEEKAIELVLPKPGHKKKAPKEKPEAKPAEEKADEEAQEKIEEKAEEKAEEKPAEEKAEKNTEGEQAAENKEEKKGDS